MIDRLKDVRITLPDCVHEYREEASFGGGELATTRPRTLQKELHVLTCQQTLLHVLYVERVSSSSHIKCTHILHAGTFGTRHLFLLMSPVFF